MDGWTDGWTSRTDGWTDGLTDEWTDGRTDGLTDFLNQTVRLSFSVSGLAKCGWLLVGKLASLSGVISDWLNS